MADELPAFTVRASFRALGALLQVAGAVLIIFGALRPMNWSLIVVGAVLGPIGFVARSGLRLRGADVVFSDPMMATDRTLQVVNDEVRSALGYTVRKLTDGVQYIEGDHSLSIRSAAPADPPAPDQPQFQETISQRSSGTHLSYTSVTVKLLSRTPLRWDPPNENEPLSSERLAEITERIAHAVMYYETHRTNAR